MRKRRRGGKRCCYGSVYGCVGAGQKEQACNEDEQGAKHGESIVSAPSAWGVNPRQKAQARFADAKAHFKDEAS